MEHRFDIKIASLCAFILAGSVFSQTGLAKKSNCLLGLTNYSISNVLNLDKKEIFSKSLYCEPLKNNDYKQISDILDNIPYGTPLFNIYLAYRNFPLSGDINTNRMTINFYFRF